MIVNSPKIGFVILNYKTYKDTLRCLKSLQEQHWNNLSVYVVENGSKNKSFEILSSEKTRKKYQYVYIHSDINVGFAQGNNLGILAAKNARCDFIICSNSDIIIQSDGDPTSILTEIYDKDSSIAIIAPKIRDSNGSNQNPFRLYPFTIWEKIKFILFFRTGLYKLYFFIRMHLLFNLITTYTMRRKEKQMVTISEPLSGYIYAPQGSFLIFTPTFFKFFKEFDSHTFLYCEEYILAELLRARKLKVYMDKRIYVLHKESGTTKNITSSYRERVRFTLEHTFKSCLYFTKNILHFRH